jgi:hypothetical protein
MTANCASLAEFLRPFRGTNRALIISRSRWLTGRAPAENRLLRALHQSALNTAAMALPIVALSGPGSTADRVSFSPLEDWCAYRPKSVSALLLKAWVAWR